MVFAETKIPGAYLIEMESRVDHRGFFARTWCQKEFGTRGLNPRLVQINLGFSKLKGTLRGMHYQLAPDEEVKVVRCTMGSIYDVVVDLRPGSTTYRQWLGVELTAENRRMLYIPEGCAHGYLTLEDATEVLYQTSAFYSPESARGVRYDDPAFSIDWPIPVQVVSDQDKNWPSFA